MKPCSFLSLVIVMLFAACSPQVSITPTQALTPVSTNAIATTAPTLQPISTLEPTPIPKQVTHIATESCAQLMDAAITNTGALEIVYSYKKNLSYEKPEGFAGSTRSNNIQLWTWSEDHPQAALAYPLPSEALDPQLSADRHWIIFQRNHGKMSRELWVIDATGQNERKLATLSFDEVKARNPNIQSASLDYGWIPHTDKMFYAIKVIRENLSGNLPTYDTFALTDIHSGTTIQLVESGTIDNVVISPDGLQAAIITANKPAQIDPANLGSQPAALLNGGELRLINTTDGSLQSILPLQVIDDFLGYSPDGKYVFGLSFDSLIRVDTKDGTWQSIALNYTLVSASAPQFVWAGNATMLVPVTDLPAGVHNIAYDELLRSTDPSFTVWRVNLTDLTAQPVQTFKGYAPSAEFSSGGNYLTFVQKYSPGLGLAPNTEKFAAFHPRVKLGGGGLPTPTIYTLGELNTGDILTTIDADKFFSWSPYLDLYVYSQFGNSIDGIRPFGIFLGQVEKEPLFIKLEIGDVFWRPRPISVKWVDAKRFVMNVGCEMSLVSLAH